MQILIYSYYLMRSLFLRGCVGTLKILQAELSHDKGYGIETAGIKRSTSKLYFHYQGASYHVLFKIMDELKPFLQSHQFVDIGCGKGRALVVAEQAGFNELIGIEVDDPLSRLAERNVKQFIGKRKESKVEIRCENALVSKFENKPGVYFFFNPFNEEIMKQVLESVVKQNQSVGNLYVYMNPLFRKPFIELGMREKEVIKTRYYTEAIIYEGVDPTVK